MTTMTKMQLFEKLEKTQARETMDKVIKIVDNVMKNV